MALYQIRSRSPEGAKKFAYVSSLTEVSLKIAESKANHHTDIRAINLVSGVEVSEAVLNEERGCTDEDRGFG